jgi:hypothetical protein
MDKSFRLTEKPFYLEGEEGKDTGCKFYSKCLSCPFGECIKEKPIWRKKHLNQVVLILSGIYNQKTVASLLNMSVKEVSDIRNGINQEDK